MKKKCLCRIATILAIFLASFISKQSFALVSQEDLYKKSLMQGVEQCYDLYAKNSITLGEFNDWSSIFSGNLNQDEILITTHVGNKLNGNSDSNLSCQQLFNGYHEGGQDAKGIFEYYQAPNTLENMGYAFSRSGMEANEKSSTAEATTDQISFRLQNIDDPSGLSAKKVDSEGEIVCNATQLAYDDRNLFEKLGNSLSGIEDVKVAYRWNIESCSGKISLKYNNEEILSITANTNSPNVIVNSRSDTIGFVGSYTNSLSMLLQDLPASTTRTSLLSAMDKSGFYTELLDCVEIIVANKPVSYEGAEYSPSSQILHQITTPNSNDTSNASAIYVPLDNDKKSAARNMMAGIGIAGDVPGVIIAAAWNPASRYSLYYNYILDAMAKHPGSIDLMQCSSEKPTTQYYFKNSPSEWCAISISDSTVLDEEYSIAEGWFALKSGSLEEALIYLSDDASYNDMTDGDYANAETDESGELDPGSAETPDAPEGETDACFASAGAMGWILCPIISGASKLAGDVYGWAEENFLQVNSNQLLEQNSGAREAWGTVRNIANIVFIIFLIFVIFSQITGVGIDNYGIKKILPKLLLVAILINLSYIICELAIDLSNIVGSGAKSLLMNASPEVKIPTYASTPVQYATVFGSGALAAGATLILNNGLLGAVLLLFTVVISCAVAILFLFVILIVRQAGVVVGVVIAPLALLCFLLPNTEGLYKKWLGLMKGLLVVYPLCGLVIGAGNFVSRILGSAEGNQPMAIAAMLAEVLPYFAVPTLLAGSLKGMGNLGAKLSGIGKNLSGNANKRIMSSDAMKYSRQHAADRRSGINSQGQLNAIGKVKSSIAGTRIGKALGYQRSLARRQEFAKKNIDADTAAQNVLAGNIADYDERKAGEVVSLATYENAMRAAVLSNDRQAYEVALMQAQRHFGASKAANLAMNVNNSLNGQGLLSQNNAPTFLRSLGEKYGSTFAKTPDYQRYLNGGGFNKSFQAWATSHGDGDLNIGDLKDEQIVGGNAETLHRLISDGNITAADAQRIVANKDNLAKMDSVQQLILSAFAHEGQNLSKQEATAILSGGSTYKDASGNSVSVAFDKAHAEELIRQAPTEVNVVQRFNQNDPNDRQRERVYTNSVSGTYEDSRGNSYGIRQRENGSYTDEGGFSVDIDHFKQK